MTISLIIIAPLLINAFPLFDIINWYKILESKLILLIILML